MRRRAVPLPVQDVLLALVVAAMQVQGTLAKPAEEGSRPLAEFGHLGYALLIVSGLALVARRRWPAAVFVTAALASLTYYLAGYSDGPGWIGLFVALYALTAHGDGRRSVAIAGVGITALTVGWFVAWVDSGPVATLGWVFFRIAASVMAAALGESARSRRVVAADALERARQAERTREDEARSRVDAERLRIAREVHDTVAHAIAIINVHAGVTAYLLDKRPEGAREALVTIEATSAQALHEMRAVLGVLRDSGRDPGRDSDGDSDCDSDDGRLPRPGLDQVEALTAVAREAGLDVTLATVSSPAVLPSAVDHTAYRIVQEALTNVIRHVGPARVTITLDHGPDALEVRITDDGGRLPADDHAGNPAPADDGRPGRGIVGMRERCTLLGGELTVGRRPEGGFDVAARLPLASAEPAHV